MILGVPVRTSGRDNFFVVLFYSLAEKVNIAVFMRQRERLGLVLPTCSAVTRQECVYDIAPNHACEESYT